jgi:hypothetical protein
VDLKATLGQAVGYLAPDLRARPRPSPLEIPLRVGEHLFGTIVGVGNDYAIGHVLHPLAIRIPAQDP